jgi:hypothetical protein
LQTERPIKEKQVLEVPESESRDKSQQLISVEKAAETIRAYWRARGHDVKVWVELAQVHVEGCQRDEYVIRSNLRNGRPSQEAV